MENKTILTSILVLVAAVILVAVFVPINIPDPFVPSDIQVDTFDSYDDLTNYIAESKLQYSSGGYGRGGLFGGMLKTFTSPGMMMQESAVAGDSGGASDYSETNIQVEGVDEPDIVKNDGKYIYTVSGEKVIIVNAFPASDMKVLSEIEFGSNIRNIFINDDKLIVFGQGYESLGEPVACKMEGVGCGGYSTTRTLVNVYDISDRQEPELEREIRANGNYVDARMIGDYVYVISSEYVYGEEPMLPVFEINGELKEVEAEDITYFPYPDYNFAFTNIMSINVNKDKVETGTYLTGATQNIYVSEDNIFLTGTKRVGYDVYLEEFVEEVAEEVLPLSEMEEVEDVLDSDKNDYEKYAEVSEIIADYSGSLDGDDKEDFDGELADELEDFERKIAKQIERTVVHKISIDKYDIDYVASGEVPGHVLNQFSMDEHKDNFRIATTTGQVWGGGSSSNHIFVLDKDMEMIGSVEDLAPGEKIYSARFLGDRAYLVTFKKVDPFFVIDLSDPKEPEVLGYLKIPGYSDYLHPYDENHVIGIGKNTVEAADELKLGRELDFAWYQGIKVSLFDVSDVKNPKEVAKIEIGDRGTESFALHDHKAFLFDKDRNLLVIPILLAEIDESRYEGGEIPDTAYGEAVWQGAYVLHIDEDEISVKGKITHNEDEHIERWYWQGSKYSIQRTLFMDDVLYTISLGRIKANDLNTIDEIKSVDLPYEDEGRVYYSE